MGCGSSKPAVKVVATVDSPPEPPQQPPQPQPAAPPAEPAKPTSQPPASEPPPPTAEASAAPPPDAQPTPAALAPGHEPPAASAPPAVAAPAPSAAAAPAPPTFAAPAPPTVAASAQDTLAVQPSLAVVSAPASDAPAAEEGAEGLAALDSAAARSFTLHDINAGSEGLQQLQMKRSASDAYKQRREAVRCAAPLADPAPHTQQRQKAWQRQPGGHSRFPSAGSAHTAPLTLRCACSSPAAAAQ